VDPKKTKDIVDVAFGVPAYMQQFWNSIAQPDSMTAIPINSHMAYSQAVPNEDLVKQIKILHAYVGNASTIGYTIVVGNGASQVVSALGYALSKRYIHNILIEPPFWGRLRSLLNMGAYAANASSQVVKTVRSQINGPWVKFAISPNNPDGKDQKTARQMTIVDMCYNWPQYKAEVEKGIQDVMIFSLSKATGHAGSRIGWALIKDKDLANDMAGYIRIATAGVSGEAQLRAIDVIKQAVIPRDGHDCFKFGTYLLRARWARFKEITSSVSDFKILNSSGMFAWCEHSIKDAHKYVVKNSSGEYETVGVQGLIRDKYRLEVTPGHDMGLDYSSNCFRINLGCSEINFNKMMEILANGSKTQET
jgi:histidinol-phosphate/aromatic aminotransferase/cobyric acid decarboxylase-like protein